MLSKLAIKHIQDILRRISKGKEVSLKERLYIQKIADSDQKIMSWLTKARKLQTKIKNDDSIDLLLNGLDLGSSEDDFILNPDPEDLGNWFSGAPSWVARS